MYAISNLWNIFSTDSATVQGLSVGKPKHLKPKQCERVRGHEIRGPSYMSNNGSGSEDFGGDVTRR